MLKSMKNNYVSSPRTFYNNILENLYDYSFYDLFNSKVIPPLWGISFPPCAKHS